MDIVTYALLKGKGGGGGGADNRFFSVKITTTAGSPSDVSVCDKSSIEIEDAIAAGKILIVTDEYIGASPEDSYTASFIPPTTTTAETVDGLIFTIHNSFVTVDSGYLIGIDAIFRIDEAKSVTTEYQEIAVGDGK